ncbi:MAG: hypothetical protein Q9160_004276 [Pyrenula sp. 1 TL-2023]
MAQRVKAGFASTMAPRHELPFLSRQQHEHYHCSFLRTSILLCPFFALTLLYRIYGSFPFPVNVLSEAQSKTKPSNVDDSTLSSIQQCAVSAYRSTGLPWLSTSSPLPLEEFVDRRTRVAEALRKAGVDALVVEPGFWFQWLANVSQVEWESWEPEERPFLMIIQPAKSISSNSSPSPILTSTSLPLQPSAVEADSHTAFLVPSFEAARARLLNMPFPNPPSFVTYEEHWDPYMTLLNSSVFPFVSDNGCVPSIVVGDEMRDFISRALSQVGFSVHGMVGSEVEKVRMRKTAMEVGILRAVNTGTVVAIRAVRKCLKPGLSEEDVRQVLDETLGAGGLTPFFDIVLFAQVWDVISRAQDASMSALRQANATAASIDLAARDAISVAGYGEAFTHRVGHGIGMKGAPPSFFHAASNELVDNEIELALADSGLTESTAHEPPYLHQGNKDTTIEEKMVMTLEPGVYLKEFGVRTEDVVMVVNGGGEDLRVEVLSGQRANGPWDP